MSKKIETNQKHMTHDNRVIIEKRLDAFPPLSAIATELGKDPTTIPKEIKKHNPFKNIISLMSLPFAVHLQGLYSIRLFLS